MIRAIVAVDEAWGIGKNNDLLFRLPDDMKFFRETTLGKTVVMGSNTLKSFPGSKPLGGRTNIVLYPGGEKRDDCLVLGSFDELLDELWKRRDEEVFVIGGAMLYRSLLPYCDDALVTKVSALGGAEAFFENLDALEEWKMASESEPLVTNGYEIRFTRYVNAAPKEVKRQ